MSLKDISKCFATAGDFFKKTNNNDKYRYKVDISEDIQTIKCNKTTYKFSKLLGSGAYGKVYLFKSTDSSDEVVLKVEQSDFPTERQISKVLEEQDVYCDTILLRYVKSIPQTKNHFYVMNKMSGDLVSLINNLVLPTKEKGSFKIFLKLIENIRLQVSCLAKKGFYYTDLKAGNILYCEEKDNSIVVSLGDLGSVHTTHHYQIATFPPPEYSGERGYFMVKQVKYNEILSWLLGCLAASVVISHIDTLSWSNGTKIIENTKIFTEQLDKQCKKYMTKPQIDLIKRMLSLDPKERPDIHQPFYEFF